MAHLILYMYSKKNIQIHSINFYQVSLHYISHKKKRHISCFLKCIEIKIISALIFEIKRCLLNLRMRIFCLLKMIALVKYKIHRITRSECVIQIIAAVSTYHACAKVKIQRLLCVY